MSCCPIVLFHVHFSRYFVLLRCGCSTHGLCCDLGNTDRQEVVSHWFGTYSRLEHSHGSPPWAHQRVWFLWVNSKFGHLKAPQHAESSHVHFCLFSFTAKYFNGSCVPGADPESNLCKLCKGAEGIRGIVDKCKASTAERYYGYAGAFRYDSHKNNCKQCHNYHLLFKVMMRQKGYLANWLMLKQSENSINGKKKSFKKERNKRIHFFFRN